MKHELQELTFKILYPLKEGFETIQKSMRRTIKDYKKEEISLVITKVEYRKEHLIVQYEGEKISKLKKMLKRGKWVPERTNLLELLCPNVELDEFIYRTEKQLEQKYNAEYNVRVLGISRRRGEKKTFAILLAEKVK